MHPAPTNIHPHPCEARGGPICVNEREDEALPAGPAACTMHGARAKMGSSTRSRRSNGAVHTSTSVHARQPCTQRHISTQQQCFRLAQVLRLDNCRNWTLERIDTRGCAKASHRQMRKSMWCGRILATIDTKCRQAEPSTRSDKHAHLKSMKSKAGQEY